MCWQKSFSLNCSCHGLFISVLFVFWPEKKDGNVNECKYMLQQILVTCNPQTQKQTNHGTAQPDYGCLAWDHRRPQRHMLWARLTLTYPWSVRVVKLLRVERQRLILVVVYFVFCAVVVRTTFSYQWYLLCRKSISDRPKWPIFARS